MKRVARAAVNRARRVTLGFRRKARGPARSSLSECGPETVKYGPSEPTIKSMTGGPALASACKKHSRDGRHSAASASPEN
jgi:hypothetical protein